jgi:hypothetical protein
MANISVDHDSKDEELKLIKNCVAQLAEHFESVHIVCTKPSGENTAVLTWGGGTWFARYGSLRDCVIKMEEQTRIGVRQGDDAGNNG